MLNEAVAKRLDPKFSHILGQVEPYVLTFPENLKHFDLNPWGHTIPESNCISCIDSSQAKFFINLQSLDSLSFGPVGMPMERWVFFDCGEMPGCIFGFAVRAKKLGADILSHYQEKASSEDLIPISMYIAIPMANKNSWFGHNLCSANRILKNEFQLPGLALLTKAMGIKVMRIEKHFGATQWGSPSLNIHLQLANMQIKSAFTPAHSFDETITYLSEYTDEKLLNALSGKNRVADEYDFLASCQARPKIIELQQQIENGKNFTIVGRPVTKNDEMFLPIKEGVYL